MDALADVSDGVQSEANAHEGVERRYPMGKPESPTATEKTERVTPDAIMQLGLGFWGSKTLLSAVELGLFAVISKAGPLDAEELRERLGLHPRSARDFFDALVALGMLARTNGRYSNTLETDLFLDPAKPTYMGGILEMANARLYTFWGSLTEGLRTGQPQSEVKTGGDFFETLYADPEKLAQFAGAMTGLSLATGDAIAAKFPWRDYGNVIDIGCAQGAVPVAIATAHDHVTGGGFDLPPVEPIFNSYVARFGLADRLSFTAGNFFADPLPSADVLIMGHILHDWDLDQKRLLLQKAYAALPKGGALIVYDAIIDDDRRENAFGLLMSLNMLIEGLGFDYTGADCRGWMADSGFSESYVEHLVGPDSMVVAIK
jgi:O-methyltransferase domain/Dimerisation domain